MYPESDLLPISALQHWLFCPRQCGLIHLEQIWEENRLTTEGRQMHQRVHEADNEKRPGLRIVRGLRIHSYRLGLIGQTDVVEFHQADTGIKLPGTTGFWRPFPVEYKRGRRRKWDNDDVQLCAQALCLEEMLGVNVPRGAIFHVKSKRRREVAFTPELRAKTEQTARRLHELIAAGKTPPPVLRPRCRGCSLRELCLPELLPDRARLRAYHEELYRIES